MNRILEGLVPLMRTGRVEFDGSELKIASENDVHTEKNDKISGFASELEDMASCAGISMEDFVSSLYGMIENGTIVIGKTSLSVCTSDWAEEFENTCHDLCIPVEKAAESAIKALKKGSL